MRIPSSDSDDSCELLLRVSELAHCATDVVSLCLRPTGGEQLPSWGPGAHLELTFGPNFVRQYSLCGETESPDLWRIAVRREATGRGGSQWIHDRVRCGDVLEARGPRNNFRLMPARRYLFIAGGIGITPILPMAREVARQGQPWTLLYGGRNRASMPFVDELGQLAGGAKHVVPEDENGLLDLASFLDTPDSDTAIYCCGPGPLIDAVERRCAIWPAGALHRERFSPRSEPTQLEDGFTVRLDRSGIALPVPAERSLLEVLEEAGFAVDNSCRAGICGTCLQTVLGGVPDHRDDVLTDEERDAGDTILPCVSRSRTTVLVLDL
jgi:ferredoxin-NADP reductase